VRRAGRLRRGRVRATASDFVSTHHINVRSYALDAVYERRAVVQGPIDPPHLVGAADGAETPPPPPARTKIVAVSTRLPPGFQHDAAVPFACRENPPPARDAAGLEAWIGRG